MSAYDRQVQADFPAGWWRLTDPAGSTTLFDFALQGQTATLSPGQSGQPQLAGLGATGPIPVFCDTAAQFDGSTSWFKPNLALSGPALTVEAWFKRNASQTGNPRLANTDHTDVSPYNGFELFLASGTTPTFIVGNGTTSTSTVAGPAVTDTNWHHLVAVFDGAHTTMTLYLDGAQVGQITNAVSTMTAGASTLTVGVGQYGGDYFAGYMAQVAAYTTVLSASRVAAHYAAALLKAQPQRPYIQCVAAWSNWQGDDPTTFKLGPAIGAGVWTDLTDYLFEYDITGGKQYVLDQFEARTLTLTLDNLDNRFSPWNTSGPYSGHLVPKKWVQVLVGGHPRFCGLITEVDDDWPDVKTQRATIMASDTLRALQGTSMAFGLYRETVLDGASGWGTTKGYFRLDETGGTVANDLSGNGMAASYIGQVTYNVVDGPDADIDTSITVAPGGIVIPNAFASAVAGTPTIVTAMIKTKSSTAAPGAPLLTLANGWGLYEVGGNVTLVGSAGTLNTTVKVNDGNWHQVSLVYDPNGGGSGYGTFYGMVVNGIVVTPDGRGGGSMTTSTAPAVSNVSQFSTSAGSQVTVGGGSFTGSIDEISVMTFTGDNNPQDFIVLYLMAAWLGYPYGLWTSGETVQYWTRSILPASIATSQTAGVAVVQQVGKSLQTTSILSYCQQMETTEGGAFYCDRHGVLQFMLHDDYLGLTTAAPVIKFGDQPDSGECPFVPGARPVVDDQRIFTSAQATNDGTGNSLQVNTQSSYGTVTWQATSNFLALNDSDVLARLEYVTYRYGQPQVRIPSFTVDVEELCGDTGQLANLNAVLQSDLLSPVVFNRHDIGLAQSALILHVAEKCTVNTWTIDFSIGATDPAPYLTLDDPTYVTLDGSNVLAY